jgi:hypothetical protein
MKPTNIITILIMVLLTSGCIKPFSPELNDDSIGKYVVEGTVSSESEWHEITISKTSSVNRESFIPVDDCKVIIMTSNGNAFGGESAGNGLYRVYINSSFLQEGVGIKVLVTTPEGKKIESDFDVMPKTIPLGNIEYTVENHTNLVTGEVVKGVQFYTTLNVEQDDSPYLRWQMIETWEYHSDYPIEFYYDGAVQHVYPPDYSQFYCWTTDYLDQIFTINTSHLSANQIENIHLHFIDNKTARLSVLYSVLINQMTLSYDAYNYWEQLKVNSTVQGNLYPSQPLAIRGNLHYVGDEDMEVLGFFQAAGISSQRLFVSPPPDFELNFNDRCDPTYLRKGFREINPLYYPAYLLEQNGGYTMNWMNDECVLCSLRGGKTQKPDFWPSNNPMP